MTPPAAPPPPFTPAPPAAFEPPPPFGTPTAFGPPPLREPPPLEEPSRPPTEPLSGLAALGLDPDGPTTAAPPLDPEPAPAETTPPADAFGAPLPGAGSVPPPVAPPAPAAVPARDDAPAAAGARPRGSARAVATDHLIDHRELARPRPGEWVALALAVLLPPIGLIAGIVAAARSARRRGWAIPLTKLTIAVAVVGTIVAGIGASYAAAAYQEGVRHDATARASIAFCAAVREDPELLASPTYGWPGPQNTIPESISAMQAYVDRWTAIASTAPAGLRPGVQGLADTAAEIVQSVETSRRITPELNFERLRGAIESSGIDRWVATYCD